LVKDTPKLGVWIPDGDGACNGLLKFALNEENFEHTVVAFVVSMSTPWTIMDSLKKWAKILTDHINQLNISEDKRQQLYKQQKLSFLSYVEPDENQQANKLSLINTNNIIKNENDKDFDEDLLATLNSNILTQNLGIPIFVIVTKVVKALICISVLISI
jgi:dynein light intermediate chain 1, cytosolic